MIGQTSINRGVIPPKFIFPHNLPQLVLSPKSPKMWRTIPSHWWASYFAYLQPILNMRKGRRKEKCAFLDKFIWLCWGAPFLTGHRVTLSSDPVPLRAPTISGHIQSAQPKPCWPYSGTNWIGIPWLPVKELALHSHADDLRLEPRLCLVPIRIFEFRN